MAHDRITWHALRWEGNAGQPGAIHTYVADTRTVAEVLEIRRAPSGHGWVLHVDGGPTIDCPRGIGYTLESCKRRARRFVQRKW